MNKRTCRLRYYSELILFSLSLIISCKLKKEDTATPVSILWEDGRASGLFISKDEVPLVVDDSLSREVEVRLLKAAHPTAIAGNFTIEQDGYLFKPLIPFTRGLQYAIFVKGKPLSAIIIPKDSIIPKLLAIYPSKDSLPENLLKIHLFFSKPMVEGHSSQFIKLTDAKGDSLPDTFLTLQSELWNKESTELTLWLDPGRIKRDLVPNKLFGPPLKNGRHYQLIISADWPDQEGNLLMHTFNKVFTVVARDTVSPSPARWKLTIPKYGTVQPLVVDLDKSLDYILLENAIWVVDGTGNSVNGSVQIDNGEMKYRFTPEKPWLRGGYKLEIEARLEDLAGNNLNRLFELDLKNPHHQEQNKKLYEKKWQIE